MSSTGQESRIPPLPPSIQTTILSHLLPPSIPLPQQLLSKSLLQRHLYLPPSPIDIDAWLAPVPELGLSEKLDRLAGVGWRVSSGGVEYASDGESSLARLRVIEEGGEDLSVDVLFEWEGGRDGDGRGWTYLSVGTAPALEWNDDPARLTLGPSNSNSISNSNGNDNDNDNDTSYLQTEVDEPDSAPTGYWAGFSPPSSPRIQPPEDAIALGGGEEDYWASYDKAFTPAGGATPAIQRSPPSGNAHADLPPPGSEKDGDQTPPTRSRTGSDDGLLRSRMEMKIASLLRRLWTSYEPTLDAEYRALTFLSLARDVQNQNQSQPTGGDTEMSEAVSVREKLEMLYEIYGVMEKDRQLAAEGFYRLVEGSLSAFGPGDRQDSSAQLNYWE